LQSCAFFFSYEQNLIFSEYVWLIFLILHYAESVFDYEHTCMNAVIGAVDTHHFSLEATEREQINPD